MTANWELFAKDPRSWAIPNQGVTKVGTPKDEGDWKVLRWELESFVCDGEYARGLERMLGAYLAGLARPEQTAAWVSGFYGSGKSHVTRMLAELWIDREFPDGGTARGLTNLSQDVSDAFVELDNAGKRSGGRWAATGKLGSGVTDSYRLAFLSVLFDSAGLPTQYSAARFALKLRSENVYDAVVSSLEDAGKDPRREFLQMYASGVLHEVVLEKLPGFAKDTAELREILREGYPRVTDISDDELKIVMGMVLESQSTGDGEIPHTVIVLDEVQQYVAQDNDRLDHVQNITELVSASFDSKVMIVATGQSALAGNPMLSKVQHRFPTKVELSDKDVEQVTRQLVLRKKPEMMPVLSEAIDGVRGKVDSHLSGTKIAASALDASDLPYDYPILPVRRRLWERMLRAIDVSGGAGQLRTQLRMTHEANQAVAELKMPSVVGADYIYFDQAQGMLSGRVLSQDMYQRIIDCDDGTPEGELQRRVLALVFMISQLPREAGADIEVRSRPDTLAQLLVTDLASENGQLNDQVKGALESLVAAGALVQIEGEYTLQTPAGAELHRKFREQIQRVLNSAADMSTIRNEALKEAVNRELSGLVKNQGVSQVNRSTDVVFGSNHSAASGQKLPIWVQAEWSTSAKAVEDAARLGGINDPTVYVFLPKVDAAGFDDALARAKAADLVLAGEPAAHTPESAEARRSLEAERDAARTEVIRRAGDVLAEAVVRQGGGSEVAAPGGLRSCVDVALDAALTRRYPKFSQGDHANWSKVADRAREGNPKATEAIGHQGEVQDHAVPKVILPYLGTSKTGAQVREHFTGGEYGWPRDAVDGALLALLAAGLVEAKDKSQRDVEAGSIRTPDIPSTTFAPVSIFISASDRLKAKGMLSRMGISAEGSTLSEGIARMIERFDQTVARINGPNPLPATVDLSVLDPIRNLTGNEAIRAVLDAETQLEALHNQVSDLAILVEPRTSQWDLLMRLQRHAEGSEIGAQHTEAIKAIRTEQQLLETPDPVAPIVTDFVEEFRVAISELHGVLATAIEDARQRIMESPEWAAVDAASRDAILKKVGLQVPATPNLGEAGQVVAALDASSLSAWRNRIDAVSTREAQVMTELARLAQPEAKVVRVKLPSRIIKSPEDIEAYVGEVRTMLEANLEDGTHLSV